MVAAAMAIALAIPAQASPEGDAAFMQVMDDLNIVSHHGHIDNNSREWRSTLATGYGICNSIHSGISPLDVERNLLVNAQTRASMGQPNQLDGHQIRSMVNAARQFLCPDTL